MSRLDGKGEGNFGRSANIGMVLDSVNSFG